MPITAVCTDTTYLPNGPANFNVTISLPETVTYLDDGIWIPYRIIELVAMSNSAPSGTIGDKYYNTSTHSIYAYTTNGWVFSENPITRAYGVIYKLRDSPILYCYVGDMIYVFDHCTVRASYNGIVEGTTTCQLNGLSYSFNREYQYDYNNITKVIITVRFFDGNNNSVDSAEADTTFDIFGREGSWDFLREYSGFKEYNTTNDMVSVSYIGILDGNHGSILIPIVNSSHWGFAWGIDKISGGVTSSATLEDAVNNSWVRVNSSIYNYNNSTLSLQFIQPAEYNIRLSLSYRDSQSTIHNGNFIFKGDIHVYNPSKPVLSRVSVTPTEYQTGSTDPLNGLPPYTVQWRDDTVTTDSLQIPQKNITIDFGDSESGISNRIFIENTGNTLIAVPLEQLSHIYGGYGAYVAQITITDKNGNVTSGNAQFAPNKTPRLIKPTTLTPLTGDQPLLVEGNAYVAGSPLPDVKWSYALRGGDQDYYAGEKEGVYAQLSLLAGGTYDVTCEAKNEDTVIDTTPFEVEVDPQDTYEDTAVAMNNFDVAVYDSGGNLVDLMQPADHVKYVDNYASGAAVSFRVPMSYRFIERLTRYCIFDVGYLNKARRMVVVGFSESQDGTYVEIQGKDLPSFISGWRVATVATNSTSGNGKDIQTCSGEALLRYWVAVNNESGTLRQVDEIVVVEENQDRGGKCVYSARFGKISDTLIDICKSSDLGYESSLQESGKVGIKVRDGVDTDILFSGEENGVRNAIVNPYSEYEEPNVAIGAGSGDGASRQYTDYGATTASGLSRREIFVDAGDSATDEEVEREAKLRLNERQNSGLYVTPTKDCPYIFGSDYSVGDYVTVRTKSGLFLKLQITSAETSNYTRDGVITVLCCGTDLRGQSRINREMDLANLYAKK